MMVTISVRAVYENGILRPLQPLPLSEHAQVDISVVAIAASPPVVEDRLREMHVQTNEWLRRQSAHAVRLPPRLSPVAQASLDAELDKLLAEIDAEVGDVSEDEITALVDKAVSAVRRSLP